MTAAQHRDEQQHTSHAWSVAQKLACLVALAACSEPVDQVPVDPNDLDGDGIPNAEDDCPSADDPLQHDEDGDRIGDVCDNCPTVANKLQEDRSEVDLKQFADHVGDACDPQPGRGGTKIKALHTFAVDNTIAWRGGGWTIADDVARATGTAMWQHSRSESGGSVAAVVTFSSVEWTAGGEVYVLLDGDGLASGSRCSVVQDPAGGGLDTLMVEEIGTGVDPITTTIGPISPGTPLSLSVQRALDKAANNGTISCRAIYGTTNREIRLETDASVVGQYAFGSSGAVTDVGSVIVYAGPQPCPDTTTRACPQ